MNNVVQIHAKAQPGIIRLYSGETFDLMNPDIMKIHIRDIAWSLANQIRFNGQIPYAYSVARHSIVGSYYIDQEYALEFLLHDSGEAYVGDMVSPLKLLCPEFEEIEDKIAGQVFLKFAGGQQVTHRGNVARYHKSDIVDTVDFEMYEHECYLLKRPGRKIMKMYDATRLAEEECGLGKLTVSGNDGDYEAFMTRFEMLVNKEIA